MPKDQKSRVFVTQGTSKLNLAKAHRLGELVELLPENTHITMSPQPVLRELRQKLRDFGDDDYLLLLGDPVAIGLAVFVAGEANTGRVRCLKWDKHLNDYYIVKIDLHDKIRGEHAEF